MTDAEKLALFDYIQAHEASDGVIARRLLWAKEAERVLGQLAECDLHEGNCASLEIASKRIRNLARKVLAEMHAAPAVQP